MSTDGGFRDGDFDTVDGKTYKRVDGQWVLWSGTTVTHVPLGLRREPEVDRPSRDDESEAPG